MLAKMMPNLVTLYRPVGQKEYELIRDTGFRSFPPRLPHQPIFYPVLTERYAIQIARDWNTKDAASDFVGYVACFQMPEDFLARDTFQKVGSAEALEYWIPAEELDEFNRHIAGLIKFTHEFLREILKKCVRSIQNRLSALFTGCVKRGAPSRKRSEQECVWDAPCKQGG